MPYENEYKSVATDNLYSTVGSAQPAPHVEATPSVQEQGANNYYSSGGGASNDYYSSGAGPKNSYGAYHDADANTDHGGGDASDFSDDEEDEGAHVDTRPHQPNPRGLRTKEMGGAYHGEQENAGHFRGTSRQIGEQFNAFAATPGANFTKAKTNYLRPEAQAAAGVEVQDGKLMRGGAPLDTRAATGTGTFMQSGEGKHIFTMTPDEEVRSIDPWAAHTEEANDDEGSRHTIGMVNHSSLAALEKQDGSMTDGKVAAAGEIAAENGKLTQVSDASGHYRPDNVMTGQALEHFLNAGVDMHDVAVKLTGKAHGESNLHASAREFMSHGGAEDAEEKMRDQRNEMKSGVKQASRELKSRQAAGVMNMAGQKVAATPERKDPRVRAPRLKKSQDLIGLFEGLY